MMGRVTDKTDGFADLGQKDVIAITGAGGTVGKALVPLLKARGFQLLLAGRDPAALRSIFPDDACCSLDELTDRMPALEGVLHLASLNTDAHADEAEFSAVNVELTAKLARAAADAGVGHFMFASSIHALDPANSSAYAASKRAAEAELARLGLARQGLGRTTVLNLAAVHGPGVAGRLRFLSRLPRFLRQPVLWCAAAWKPVVHVEAVAGAVANVLETPVQTPVEGVGATPPIHRLVLADDQGRNPVYRFCSRAIDLAFALFVVLLFGWLILIIAGFAGRQAGASGILWQTRAGRDGRPFDMAKLRTMRKQAAEVPTHESSADEITPLGKILRSTKVDELPQALNILAGHMSLIGPRPSLMSQDDLIAERRARGVLKLRPGVTGYSQVRGADMRDPVGLAEMDSHYMKLRCLWLDLRIIIATLPGMSSFKI
jgi:lipopolysaccharide/colanic/teichoic acid biosynthesis glycosyltransferase/uncharacterized protein YbjT (DUF2867 family)